MKIEELKLNIHRRAAKCAEDIYFIFAVDPPKTLEEGEDVKYK